MLKSKLQTRIPGARSQHLVFFFDSGLRRGETEAQAFIVRFVSWWFALKQNSSL